MAQEGEQVSHKGAQIQVLREGGEGLDVGIEEQRQVQRNSKCRAQHAEQAEATA